MKNSIVVSFFAGPGARKSTITYDVFSKLKWKNINCEVANEYAKEKVWEKSFNTLDNQIFVFGKQHHRLWRLVGQCDVVLTDSPLLLSIIYDKEKRVELKNLVLSEFNKFNSLNYFVERKAKFNPAGRIQNEEESKQIDCDIKLLLDSNNIKYKSIFGEKESVDIIVEDIITEINNKRK